MPPPWRSRLLLALLCGAAIIVIVSSGVLFLKPAILQRQAVVALRALGAVVTYDYQLQPTFATAGTHGEFREAHKDVTSRRDLADPDHDGRAWLRRIVGPDLFCDVVGVNLAYSYGPNETDRQEPAKVYSEELTRLKRFPELRLLLLSGDQARDPALEALRGLSELRVIYLWDANVTDAGVENLRGLKKLQYLHLSGAGLTDSSLAVFGELPELEGLLLQGNRFTDEGLAHLRNLTKLRTLWLCSVGPRGDSTIRGPGLVHLSGLSDLEDLGLQDTHFSDAGVEPLGTFKRLHSLALHDCDLTVEGLARLREIQPTLQIDISQP